MLLVTPQDTLPVSVSLASPSLTSVAAASAAVIGVAGAVNPNAEILTLWADNNPRIAGLPTIPGRLAQTIIDTRTIYVLVPSPGTDVNRAVTFMSIKNADGLNSFATAVSYTNASGVAQQIKAIMLGPGETLQFGSATGFQILDANGLLKAPSTSQAADTVTAIQDVQEEIEQDQEPTNNAILAELRILLRAICQMSGQNESDFADMRSDPDLAQVGIQPING